MGVAMAALQVAINPLLRVAGGPEHFAFNSAMAQFVFGSASFLSPLVYAYLVGHVGVGSSGHQGLLGVLARVTPASMPWVAIYWLFALTTLLMALFIGVLKLPVVERSMDESAGSAAMYGSLLKDPTTSLFFIAIFAYVGCEQGSADWMSEFLSRYHGFDPHGLGARAVAYFWGLLMAGCLIGMLLLKFFDGRRVLIGFSIAALALNSVRTYHGPLAGILCTGIMGGAIVPLLIGRLGDRYGLRTGLLLLYLTFGYVLSVGFWARPLVSNALLQPRDAA